MEAPGYFLYIPPTAMKARFIMIEESSKKLYDIDLVAEKLNNPGTWKVHGITPATTGKRLAIMIPVRLADVYEEHIANQEPDSRPYNPDFECGKLISITKQEEMFVHGQVIGRVNVCPFPENIMSWDKLKEYKGMVIHDEMRNCLLARVFGGEHTDCDFVHPETLAQMPRNWHQDAAMLNTELDGIWASGDAIQEGSIRWVLSE